MDFIYVSQNIKDAIKRGGKFPEDENEIYRTIILGDERSAMVPQFFALVAVWVRFHNVVIDEFNRLYPGDDLLPPDVRFHEARRFVIAVYQNIFYTEALPFLVSARSISRYRLTSKKYCYDPKVDPSVTVEFTSSSARYFHTFLQNGYIVNFKNGTKANILLRNLNDASLGFQELAGVLSGLMERPWNTLDIASEVNQ